MQILYQQYLHIEQVQNCSLSDHWKQTVKMHISVDMGIKPWWNFTGVIWPLFL